MSSIGPEEIRREIQQILKDGDLNTLSSKKVRQLLEQTFQCDFTERKKEIDDILMAEITTRDAMPIPRRTYATNANNETRNEISDLDESSQSQSEFPSTTQPTAGAKSDEEIAMEIHQQENRPSLRRPSVSERGKTRSKVRRTSDLETEQRHSEQTVRRTESERRTTTNVLQQGNRHQRSTGRSGRRTFGSFVDSSFPTELLLSDASI